MISISFSYTLWKQGMTQGDICKHASQLFALLFGVFFIETVLFTVVGGKSFGSHVRCVYRNGYNVERCRVA